MEKVGGEKEPRLSNIHLADSTAEEERFFKETGLTEMRSGQKQITLLRISQAEKTSHKKGELGSD